MPKRKDMRYWNVPTTPHLDDLLEKAVKLDTHVTKSDFVRDAVRQKLEQMGFKATPYEETHNPA